MFNILHSFYVNTDISVFNSLYIGKGNGRTNEKSRTIDKMKEEDQRKTKQSEKEISQK